MTEQVQILSSQLGTVLSRIDWAFEALLYDAQDLDKPAEIEEIEIELVADHELGKCKPGAKFRYLEGYHITPDGRKSRIRWIEWL